eukprot:271763-Rhodomonas_salina.1
MLLRGVLCSYAVYAVSGTTLLRAVRYCARVGHRSPCGTELGYDATRLALEEEVRALAQEETRLRASLETLEAALVGPMPLQKAAIGLQVCYAMSGTGIAHGGEYDTERGVARALRYGGTGRVLLSWGIWYQAAETARLEEGRAEAEEELQQAKERAAKLKASVDKDREEQ